MGMQGLASSRQGFVHSRQGFLGVGGPSESVIDYFPDRRNRRIVIKASAGATLRLYDMDGGGFVNDIVGNIKVNAPIFADTPSLAFFASTANSIEVLGTLGTFDYSGATLYTNSFYTSSGSSVSYTLRSRGAVSLRERMDGNLLTARLLFSDFAGGGGRRVNVFTETLSDSNVVAAVLQTAATVGESGFFITNKIWNYISEYLYAGYNYGFYFLLHSFFPSNAPYEYSDEKNTAYPQGLQKNIRDQEFAVAFANPVLLPGAYTFQKFYSAHYLRLYPQGVYKITYSTTAYPGGTVAFFANETPILTVSTAIPAKQTSDWDYTLVKRASDSRYVLILAPDTLIVLPETFSITAGEYYIEGDWLYFLKGEATALKLARINISTFVTEDIVVI